MISEIYPGHGLKVQGHYTRSNQDYTMTLCTYTTSAQENCYGQLQSPLKWTSVSPTN